MPAKSNVMTEEDIMKMTPEELKSFRMSFNPDVMGSDDDSEEGNDYED